MSEKKFFIYTRKSTGTEDRQVRSLADQLAELRELAKKEQLEIVAAHFRGVHTILELPLKNKGLTQQSTDRELTTAEIHARRYDELFEQRTANFSTTVEDLIMAYNIRKTAILSQALGEAWDQDEKDFLEQTELCEKLISLISHPSTSKPVLLFQQIENEMPTGQFRRLFLRLQALANKMHIPITKQYKKVHDALLQPADRPQLSFAGHKTWAYGIPADLAGGSIPEDKQPLTFAGHRDWAFGNPAESSGGTRQIRRGKPSAKAEAKVEVVVTTMQPMVDEGVKKPRTAFFKEVPSTQPGAKLANIRQGGEVGPDPKCHDSSFQKATREKLSTIGGSYIPEMAILTIIRFMVASNPAEIDANKIANMVLRIIQGHLTLGEHTEESYSGRPIQAYGY